MKAIFNYVIVLYVLFSHPLSASIHRSYRHSEVSVNSTEAPVPVKGNYHYTSDQTFYSCEFVDWRVQTILGELGLVNFASSCSGGLEMRSPFISVRYQFLVPSITDGPHGRLIRFNEYSFNDTWGGEGVGCDVTINFIRQLLRSIPSESNPYTVTQISDFCWGSRGSFNVELEVK